MNTSPPPTIRGPTPPPDARRKIGSRSATFISRFRRSLLGRALILLSFAAAAIAGTRGAIELVEQTFDSLTGGPARRTHAGVVDAFELGYRTAEYCVLAQQNLYDGGQSALIHENNEVLIWSTPLVIDLDIDAPSCRNLGRGLMQTPALSRAAYLIGANYDHYFVDAFTCGALFRVARENIAAAQMSVEDPGSWRKTYPNISSDLSSVPLSLSKSTRYKSLTQATEWFPNLDLNISLKTPTSPLDPNRNRTLLAGAIAILDKHKTHLEEQLKADPLKVPSCGPMG
jgi:hypothetical protein